MTSLLWLALVTFVVVHSKIALLNRHDEGWKEQFENIRRGIRSTDHNELDKWLTSEQQDTLKPLFNKPQEFKNKIMEYYNLLSASEQAKWDAKYKKECSSWITDHISADSEKEFLNLITDGQANEAFEKWDDFISKLPEDEGEKHNVWKGECRSLLTASRRRRELDSDLVEFTKWMTSDQKKEIEALKNDGKSLTDIRAKSMEFFETLPVDQQTSLREEYKGKCKAYFGKLATEAEIAEIKSLHDSGNKGEIASKISAIVDRQPDDVKTQASKMYSVCTDVYAASKKFKRDIEAKIEKHLSWLSDEQKQTIRQMHADGKSKEDIRTTLLSWLNNLGGDAKKDAKEKTRKECYKWLDDAASKEEIAELHKLHETDHNACKTKVREYIKRLDAQTQAEIEKNLAFCEKIWYGDHDHSSHAGHAGHGHHHRKRRHLKAIEKYIDWLTPAQKSELEELENSGTDFSKILEKVREFYLAEGDDRREELKTKFKENCAGWVKDVATPVELQQLKDWKNDKNYDEIKKLISTLENRLTEDVKHTVEHVRDVCFRVWDVPIVSRRRRDQTHSHDDFFEKYLGWTSDAQKLELKMIKEGGDRGAFYKKVLEYFDESSGEVRITAIEQLKSACKHFSKDFFGEDKIREIHQLKESGATYEQIVDKLKEFAKGLGDDKKTQKALGLVEGCRHIFTAKTSRKRRHGQGPMDMFPQFEEDLMSDDEHQIGAVDIVVRAENEVSKELKSACEEEAAALFGKNHLSTIMAHWTSEGRNRIQKEKVRHLINSLSDNDKKVKAGRLVKECKRLYHGSKRHRRNHHEHSLDKAFQSFLTWTTEEQKETLRQLKEAGDKDAIIKKVLEFFDATTGETRKTATEELKGACKHFGTDIFGEEKVASLKTLRESGASQEVLKNKVLEIIGEISDEEKKTKANKLLAGCEKVYAAASRKRRDHHHHNLDDAFTKYLTWTTQEQKDALKALETAGNKEEIYKKILEYFDATSGDARKKAAEELTGACKHYGTDLFGEEKVASLKVLKESGASSEELKKKVLELVGEITDETKKSKATKLVAGCEKVYAAASRKRRDHHHHNLDDAFTKYLTWTTQEQKDALKALETAGNKEEIYKKILDYFDDTTGDTRKKAAEELKGACKHYGIDLFGEEKVASLKALKESGASNEELKKKVLELVGEITDDVKKGKATKLVAGCEKVYAAASRKRRDHHHHNLDDAFTKYLTWTTQEQKDALKALETAGNKEEIYKKILEYFDATSGDARKKAAEELTGACKHYGTDLFGEEKVASLKVLKESGASSEELKKKVLELVGEITDETKKSKATKLVAGCEKVYAAASRKRRDHHHHNLDDAFTKYLTWTTQEQKDTLKALETAGNKEEIYKKILEYFDATSGDARKKAAEELTGACKHYGTDLFGEEKVASLKTLKESGASNEELKKKVLELVGEITDETKKSKATKLVAGCEKVYAAASRKRRDDHEHNLEDAFGKYLTWITDAQKEELKALKAAGDKKAIYVKILEYFEAAQGEAKTTAIAELKGACKHYAKDYFGEAKVNEIKTLKESGASFSDIQEKIEGFVAELPADKQGKVKGIFDGCRKVFQAAEARKRRRSIRLRRAESKVWLEPAQSQELERLARQGQYSEAVRRLGEMYSSIDDNDKGNRAALRSMGVCRLLLDDAGVPEASDKLIKSAAQMDNEETVKLLRSLFEIAEDKTVKLVEPFCVQLYKERIIPSARHLVLSHPSL